MARRGESGRRGRREPGPSGQRTWLAVAYLLPALVLLGVYLLYPLGYSLWRSLFDAGGGHFTGLRNYAEVFTDPQTATALRNTVLWVVVAPVLVTALGLVFAVLTERVSWAAAVRLVLFMPMAISLFASGVIFKLVYDESPTLGLANAAAVTVHDVFVAPAAYPGLRPRPGTGLVAGDGGFATTAEVGPGSVVAVPMVGLLASRLPAQAAQAELPAAAPGELRGAVWLDFSPSGGPHGQVGAGKRGTPQITVQALRPDGTVAASTTTGDDGTFTLPGLPAGRYRLRLPAADFTAPFGGLTWLGPTLVTPVIISSWIWITTGFAMTFVAAGLAAIPRDALEAARVDGATEWQVFRRVTVPLLAPVLLVVFVTLVISVLKVFELVFVIAPGSSQASASVLALQMWQVSFGPGGGDLGAGSAIAVVLFLLVLPAMLFNIRRFRRERR
jgi:alpha-glucoside transport system permease protein